MIKPRSRLGTEAVLAPVGCSSVTASSSGCHSSASRNAGAQAWRGGAWETFTGSPFPTGVA